jgi:8-oxo-dGTP pyrophosphatase MutT (NUDIX family)
MYRKEKSAPDINKSTVISRTAVRAVILNNKKLLMAHLGKTNEYKFPGGGKEAHETIDDAIQREVLEEVGYTVEKINGKIGEIIEYDRAREGGGAVFKMVSEYYSAEVNGIPAGQNLEDYGACCKSRLLLHRLLQFFALGAAKHAFLSGSSLKAEGQ